MDDYERDYVEDGDFNDRIDDLLDRLYDIVENSKGIFGAKFDRGQALDCIEDLRGEIPNEVRRAKDILMKRDRIISDAEDEAEKIRKDAEVEAGRIVSQHETTKTVNAWVEQKKAEAADFYREMCTGANRYAEDQLNKVAAVIENRLEEFKRTAADTEEELRRSLSEIYKNKDSLANYEEEEEYPEDEN